MRYGFVLFSLVVFAVPVFPQTNFTAGVWSSYVVDNGDEPYDLPIIWASVNHDLGGGYSVGLWGSAGDQGGREIDFIAGWAGENLSVNVGYFIHAGGTTANLAQIDLRTARLVGKSTELYMMISPIMPTNSSGDSGILARVGLNHTMKLGKIELTPNGWVLYDTGIFKGERGFTLRGELGMPMKWRKITLTPVVRLSVPIAMNTREVRGIGGLNIRFP